MSINGEFALIAAIRRLADGLPASGVAVGIGDDAALVRTSGATLLSVDALIEGVHFRSAWLSPRALGRRAFRVAVSDIAAMGGKPRHALLSLAFPKTYPASAVQSLADGLLAEAAAVGVAVVGGNLSRARALAINVTISGQAAARSLTRARAKVGQAVFVTGTLGDAAAGVEQLGKGKRRGRLVEGYRLPPLRIDVGRALAARPGVGAAIDVSDGLVADLAHICRASSVAIGLDTAAVPVSTALARYAGSREALSYALAGGDDYELAFTARPQEAAALARICKRLGCRLSRIGSVEKGRPSVFDQDGLRLDGEGRGGHDHFAI
ncbi:MAG: thiamine-phosphate kinase [Deltaproteobacteria bacterium]